MKSLKTCVVTVGLALLAGVSLAQTEKGKYEVSGMFTYAHTWADLNGDTTSFDEYVGVIGLGYYLNDHWEIKDNTAILGFSGEGVDATAVAIMAGPDYHFLTEKSLVPYVGVYAGGIFADGSIGSSDASTSGLILDAHIGLKQFVASNVAIEYRLSYQYSEIEDVKLNNMMAMIGINFLF